MGPLLFYTFLISLPLKSSSFSCSLVKGDTKNMWAWRFFCQSLEASQAPASSQPWRPKDSRSQWGNYRQWVAWTKGWIRTKEEAGRKQWQPRRKQKAEVVPSTRTNSFQVLPWGPSFAPSEREEQPREGLLSQSWWTSLGTEVGNASRC